MWPAPILLRYLEVSGGTGLCGAQNELSPQFGSPLGNRACWYAKRRLNGLQGEYERADILTTPPRGISRLSQNTPTADWIRHFGRRAAIRCKANERPHAQRSENVDNLKHSIR